MRSNRGHVNSSRVARRVAMASMSVLAASGIGLVAAPMAFGQISINLGGPLLGPSSQSAGVTNSGSASANTGGNNAVGNASTNTASASVPGAAVNVPVSLGAPTNTSEGTATVSSGPASAVGNSAGTGVGQSQSDGAGGTRINGFQAQSQQAGVSNAGAASANTGGNNAVGNASRNNASVTQNVSGGLVGVGVTLGGPTNNSSGTANVTTGPASAVGNSASNTVGQSQISGGGGGGPLGFGPGFGPGGGPGGFGPGGFGVGGFGGAPCPSSRFASFQDVNVRNQGQAQANTGNNTAIGNESTNNASTTVTGAQTVSGGLVGVGLTIGGPVNNSSGVATINTGPASAIGNNSATTVSQFEGCPQVVTVAGVRPPVVVTPGRPVIQTTLARTGLDTGDLGMIAGALLAGGMLLVASQRRRIVARHATAHLAGFGLGLGADDWDRPLR